MGYSGEVAGLGMHTRDDRGKYLLFIVLQGLLDSLHFLGQLEQGAASTNDDALFYSCLPTQMAPLDSISIALHFGLSWGYNYQLYEASHPFTLHNASGPLAFLITWKTSHNYPEVPASRHKTCHLSRLAPGMYRCAACPPSL